MSRERHLAQLGLVGECSSPGERMQLNFQRFGDDLIEGLSADGPADSERSLLVEEVKVGCRFRTSHRPVLRLPAGPMTANHLAPSGRTASAARG